VRIAAVAVTGTPATDGVAAAAVSVQPAPGGVSAATSVQSPAAASAPPTFAAQMSQPVFTLAKAGNGDHTITVNVTPENLGPVTVRAHVDGSSMRIELFSASDGGRDALKQLMPDLRRDLASAGITANLDLSSQGQPDTQTGPSWQGRPTTPQRAQTLREEENVPTPQPLPHLSALGSVSTLDVLA
jgi:Flagellar hook-length control protein